MKFDFNIKLSETANLKLTLTQEQALDLLCNLSDAIKQANTKGDIDATTN